jgi:hypothetical protein
MDFKDGSFEDTGIAYMIYAYNYFELVDGGQVKLCSILPKS